MRADGKKVKDAQPMYRVAAYIMKERNDAQNMIVLDIPEEPLHRYINLRRRADKPISHLALILAAYVRTVAEFPALNRFVVNKRIYDRNELAVGMVVLKPGQTDGTINKMYFDLTDNLDTVQDKILAYIDENRAAGDTNSTDKIINILLSIPGLVSFAVGLFKLMDKWGLLPKKLIDASPFHTSMVISNLASIRTNHIFHHCYNFGTTSLLLTIGNMREVAKRKGGEIRFERCIPLGLVMDERICNGSYFAQAFAALKKYLANPEILETVPDKINRPIPYKRTK